VPVPSTVRSSGRDAHVLRLSWRTAIPCVTSKLWPLIAALSAEPRKAIVAATSSGVGKPGRGSAPSRARWSAIMPRKSFAVAPSPSPRIRSIAEKTVRIRSLSIGPGKTVLTRTPGRTELLRELARQRVQRRLRDDVGGATVVLRAREDRGHVDDARAGSEVRRRGPHHVPGTPSRLRAASSTVSLSVGQPSATSSSRVNGSLAIGASARRCRVVDEHVDPAVAGDDLLDGRAHLPRITRVERGHAHPRGADRVSRRNASRAAASRSASRPTMTTVAPSFR
jgi:hypothetical protein